MDLGYKGKTLVINGLLTSTLWYCATSLSIPSWAVTQIQQKIYRFFWSGKTPLVNRDILALPLKEGGFNIARLNSKIQELRLNTLRRMLIGKEAHWKHFIAYLLRVSGMSLGKLTLALDYKMRDIDYDILYPFTRNFSPPSVNTVPIIHAAIHHFLGQIFSKSPFSVIT